ncbi:exported hypothetical protein [Vibrio diabolicus]|nr:exported hypothetical protein [Vibrio diabolicus]
MPTKLNRKEPRKVAKAFCVVLSSINSFVARGVTPALAALYAETIILSENVVTASMEVARIFNMLLSKSLLTLIAGGRVMNWFKTMDIRAVATASKA